MCAITAGGAQHEHLTQNENKEKVAPPDAVTGRFGVGLMDALVTFDRKKIGVHISSQYEDITLGKGA